MVLIIVTAFLAVSFQAGTTLSTNADTTLLSVMFLVRAEIQDSPVTNFDAILDFRPNLDCLTDDFVTHDDRVHRLSPT